MGDNMLLDEYLEYLNDGWTPFSPDVLGPTGQAVMGAAQSIPGAAYIPAAAATAYMTYKALKKGGKCKQYQKDPEKYKQCMKGRR